MGHKAEETACPAPEILPVHKRVKQEQDGENKKQEYARRNHALAHREGHE